MTMELLRSTTSILIDGKRPVGAATALAEGQDAITL
jgi:hypothetical protein